MIDFNVPPGSKILEVGGGANPQFHPNMDVRQCQDAQGNFTVDIPGVDLSGDWPISSDEFDGVYAQFVAEHINWRKTGKFLGECFRVLKPGGKVVLVVPNTQVQMEFLLQRRPWTDNPQAKEGANPSQMLFGDLDYDENSHKSAWTPELAKQRLEAAGFTNMQTHPYGTVGTDMVVMAIRPPLGPAGDTTPGQLVNLLDVQAKVPAKPEVPEPPSPPHPLKDVPREKLFDKHYFDGGTKYGGYAPPGYADFPQHVITAEHVLARKPESVLELGCARGYVLKRLEDSGIRVQGVDISRHCQLTKVASYVLLRDLCQTPWGSADSLYDLCFSMAFLEHVPEEFLPAVFAEMKRTCKRGLHGISFAKSDFDKTQFTIRPKEWWIKRLPEGHEVFSKEELETGPFPAIVHLGDGKVKLQLGSFTTMAYYGWTNVDIHDLGPFAQANGYAFQRADVRQGLPYATGSVDLIFSHHMLEHLSYVEGRAFLRECRRVIKPSGAMRFVVPDARSLMDIYTATADGDGTAFSEFSEMNQGCAAAPTAAGKLWALLLEAHASCYDAVTLLKLLDEAGFAGEETVFRTTKYEPVKQILKETLEMDYGGTSLFVDAVPRIS